jgi:hypothetical protein
VTQTVFGIALDGLGHASSGGKHWATPADRLLTVQDQEIVVDVEHRGHPVGRVTYLERRGASIWLVAEVDDSVTPEVRVRLSPVEVRSVPSPFYFSISRLGDPTLGYALVSVALTASPARIAARPVIFKDGNAARAAGRESDEFSRGLLTRASEYDLRRRWRDTPLMVVGNDVPLIGLGWPRVEYRSA